MNHKWNYQPPSQEQTEAAKALAKETGISPILCKLLLERGITSAAEAKRLCCACWRPPPRPHGRPRPDPPRRGR